jgi:acyl-homoserine-lactone acylase
MGYETHDNNRSLRVRELLQGYHKVSYEDFKRIKYDLQLPQKLAYPVNLDTLFLFNENDHPEVADLITSLKMWDRKATIDSKGAAVFGVLFYYVAAKYENDETFKVMTKPMCLEALTYAKEYLVRNFGTIDISLGEYQRLQRGDKSFPLAGLPDLLATMYSMPSENGRLRGVIGDCYVAFAKYTPAGPEIETINCYGASNRKDSPHYNDQMELYQKQQTKKMSLNRKEVYMNAKTIYHPEVLSKIRVQDKLTRARR